jgi:hypothetical protein
MSSKAARNTQRYLLYNQLVKEVKNYLTFLYTTYLCATCFYELHTCPSCSWDRALPQTPGRTSCYPGYQSTTEVFHT